MGGNLVINYSLRKPLDNIDGIIAYFPALQTTFKPPKLKLILGNIFKKLFPSLTLNNELDINGISRNPDIIEDYRNDPLNHDRLSIQLGLDLLISGEFALEKANLINIHTLILHGKKDRLTSFDSSKKISESAGDNVNFIGFENAYHELHNEPDKDQLFIIVNNWLNSIE